MPHAARVGDQAAGEQDLALARASAAARAAPGRGVATRADSTVARTSVDQPLVALLDAVVVGLVGEREREDPLGDQVRAVDAREALRDHRADAEVERGERGLLAATSPGRSCVRRRRSRRPTPPPAPGSRDRSGGTCTARRRGCSTRSRARARRPGPCRRSRRRRGRRSARGPRSSPGSGGTVRRRRRCCAPSRARRRAPSSGGATIWRSSTSGFGGRRRQRRRLAELARVGDLAAQRRRRRGRGRAEVDAVVRPSRCGRGSSG